MDTATLRSAYDDIVSAARTGGFIRPETGWPAEILITHLTAATGLLTAVVDDVLGGRTARFDNASAVDDDVLARTAGGADATSAAGMLQAACTALLEHLDQVDDRHLATPVAVHLVSDGGPDSTVLVDREMPLQELLALQLGQHLPGHAADLQALLPAETGEGESSRLPGEG